MSRYSVSYPLLDYPVLNRKGGHGTPSALDTEEVQVDISFSVAW